MDGSRSRRGNRPIEQREESLPPLLRGKHGTCDCCFGPFHLTHIPPPVTSLTHVCGPLDTIDLSSAEIDNLLRKQPLLAFSPRGYKDRNFSLQDFPRDFMTTTAVSINAKGKKGRRITMAAGGDPLSGKNRHKHEKDDGSNTDDTFHSTAERETRGTPGADLELPSRQKKQGDAQLTQQQCLRLVSSLQQQLHASQETVKRQEHDFQKKLSKIQEKLTAVTGENQKLQKRIDNTQVKLRHAHSNSLEVSLPIKKDLRELIEKQTKTILWSMVKFIQSPQEEIMAARMLVACAHGLPEENVASKEDREATANTYKTYIRKAIVKRRNYVAAEHKKVMFRRFKDKGSMPTVPQLIKCLRRDIKDDEDFEIFEFYWDELLTKQVGSCIWSREVRRYKTICEAVRKEHSQKRLPMITPEDEAFTVLVIENSHERWLKEIEEEQNGTLQEMKKKRPANYYNGLYTLTDSGQNGWGGWKVEGLELFKKYCWQYELQIPSLDNKMC